MGLLVRMEIESYTQDLSGFNIQDYIGEGAVMQRWPQSDWPAFAALQAKLKLASKSFQCRQGLCFTAERRKHLFPSGEV